jgi:hypothetical protein
MKAYGVGAICVSGPKSPEFWKAYAHPGKFEGVLPVLWREDDTTIYQIPLRTQSFAHVVPPSAIVGKAKLNEIEKYDAALDNPALPAADFQWQGRNRILLHTSAQPDQAVSIQVNWHPGWHAKVAGQTVKLQKDGLGLMWLRPNCNGTCDIQLDYNGGWELRLTRWLSYLAWFGLLIVFPVRYFRSRRFP